MAENKPALGAGDVPLILAGEEKTLRPTLRAATEISRMAGGIAGAIQRCANFDVDTLTRVVTLGLNLTPNGAKDLPEKLFKEGYHKVAPACIKYLGALLRGGRASEDDEEAGDEQNPPTTA